ncbi:MAG: M24 family metallopeptidase [Parvibaculaceae bacterium]
MTTVRDAPRGFGAEEYRRRAKALQRQMQEADMGLLLLSTDADIRYVTGFLTRFWESPTRPWFVLVPAAGDPVAVIPLAGEPLMSRTWVKDIRTWRSPDLEDDGVSLLADTIRSLAGSGARIGLPMGHETHLRMPLADYEKVKARIAPLAFADATQIVRRVREVKSEAEVEKIRTICAIAGRAFERVPEFARQGRGLDAVFRDFQIACLSEGADWVPYVAGGAGPNGYTDVISPATSRPLEAGDVLMLDTGAIRDGYFCDFDRNFAVGHADDAVRRAHHTLYEATEAGFSAARPGATAADLYHAMQTVVAKAGWQGSEGGRLGHGLGLQLTEWPSFIPADRTPLREGMVLTLEPGLEVSPGRIMVHEENIVLRANGAELLTPRAPAEIPVLK